jgi:CheY-like chemotaxis protein
MIKLKFKQPSIIASSGEIALQFVSKRIESCQSPFKLVFMDCSMPVMDGFETTKAILDMCKKHSIAPPYIIALTGHSTEDKHVKK